MSKEMTQVSLERGTERTVTFIETWAAKVGNKVELIDSGEGMWDVVAVGGTTDKDLSRMYKDFQASTRGGGIDNRK